MSRSIGLFYGSTTGNTESVADLIAENIGLDKVHRIDIAADGLDSLAEYEHLILGIPTWDFGELQEDWADLWQVLDAAEVEGKSCALFGLGDQIGYSEWFLDAMGLLHERMRARGAKMVGYWSVEGYDFEASKALTDDQSQFVGLAIDEDCQRSETEERVTRWCQQVLSEFGMA
ncbi:flavodoxin FldB [uncultured Neptuniibacter sp.]|uniref:flavodoxin FldB n=1 Tax=uncultured Neptuniibacter sp. TaxID=502143 RepID=UPI0026070356|nr:flavodoxin FldB [uncultured Neptuniibacter sp.]